MITIRNYVGWRRWVFRHRRLIRAITPWLVALGVVAMFCLFIWEASR